LTRRTIARFFAALSQGFAFGWLPVRGPPLAAAAIASGVVSEHEPAAQPDSVDRR
jgi:hypothetical protein